MTAKDYIQQVLENVEEKHADKPEFIQTVQEFFPTLEPYLEEHSDIENHSILEMVAEPERIIQFRIPWQDDDGKFQVNLGWRVQYNSALGPYKGGIRFNPNVNESVVRFLAFDQTFKNALTNLPLGGGKGGADFNPNGKSNGEIMRFVQSLMLELHQHIGPDLDIPAGDIGVGTREIGYMYGQYKRLKQAEPGVLTGKPVSLGGSLGRTEATGYGVAYFVENALEDRGESLEGQRVVISGLGEVGKHALEKVTDLGALVVGVGDLEGYLIDENGLNAETLEAIESPDEYIEEHSNATFVPEESVWTADVTYDIALPCATQNEITEERAQNMIENGQIKGIFEGANMPTTDSAIDLFLENDILFAPGKAVNAAGVAASGLEMAQNAQHEQWSKEKVDEKIKEIMSDIYTTCSETAEHYLGNKNNLKAGANIVGFDRVATAMIAEGLV